MITYQRFMENAHLRKGNFLVDGFTDHEHCTMCGMTFSNDSGDIQDGYVTWTGDHWICPDCLLEYKKEYNWTVSD